MTVSVFASDFFGDFPLFFFFLEPWAQVHKVTGTDENKHC